MTKAELVEEVARVAELTKKDSEVIVDEVFKSIILSLNKGEKIELRGFGSFRVRERGPRRGRNPKTGSPVRSEEHTSELQSRQYLVCRLLLEKKKPTLLWILGHRKLY